MAHQHDTISHFSHPEHELMKRHYTGPFRCDMCWDGLTGPAYGCLAGCDFAIHDSCAAHQQTLSSPDHHAHPLTLIQTRQHLSYKCDVCAGSCAPGCFLYRCRPCGFDMHPGCVQPSPVVRSAQHMEHDLTLVQSEGQCAACHRRGAWFYRCAVCRDLDFHISCAAAWPGQEAGGAREEENRQYGDDGAALDLEGELLRNRILVQSHMATALSMANMGYSLTRI
ncbi:hypothetical protein QOZ80_7AG0576790 [Eleusine coracana subsp. coracana]|nr:hypothetical protein QOZ80_7AG0576790 [Eleusine coracana subsp. coracana]